MHEFHFWLFCVAVRPEQHAAADLFSFPFFPDPIGMADVIVKVGPSNSP